MGNFDVEECGLIPRTAKLFNNNNFSDIELRVKDADGAFKNFYCHKLILAMAGKEFATMFYNNSDAPKVLKILDSSPEIILVMLQYLYTDKLNLGDMKEAFELFQVANKYGIKDLIQECQKYLFKDPITLDNLFSKYQLAMEYNIHSMLQICRKLVCSETKSVLSTKPFLETTSLVVKDIVMQDMLTLEKEQDLIYAVLRWCGRECRRKGYTVDSVCLRDTISPLMMHLRFLCLSAEEFCDLTEEYDIFTSAESAILTRKILMPNCNAKIPEGFCTITRQRGLIMKSKDNSFNPLPVKQPMYNNTSTKQSPEPLFSYQKSESPPKVETSNIFQFSSGSKKVESPQPAKADSSNMFPLNNFSKKAPPPILRVLPQNCTVQKVYDFPLEEMQKGITTVIENDIKCSATIKVTKGSIMIHGIELRIAEMKSIPDECFDVFSCITVNSQTRSNTHNLKLKRGVLSMQFQDPVRASTHPVDIEITVENIKLNRCGICKEKKIELNCGLDYSADIFLKSNQINYGDNLFFLMSRIIYSTS